MGHYTGPKGRINRRLGQMVFENAGAIRALDNRDFPPGTSQRRRKISNYGLGLIEKQKIKYYYGLREKHLRRYFDKARRLKGNTGENLLILCECRLDNAIRRAGLAHSRPQARQGVAHNHFQVNGRTVNAPSIQISVGDVISVRNRPNLRTMYKELFEAGEGPNAEWVSLDSEKLEVTVTSLPTFEEVSLPLDVGKVVAFMSR
jgi:small subunit ribosomal protein S4